MTQNGLGVCLCILINPNRSALSVYPNFSSIPLIGFAEMIRIKKLGQILIFLEYENYGHIKFLLSRTILKQK